MDDATAEKQLERMIAFIEDDGERKLADAIFEVETEYQQEKKRLIEEGRRKVDEEYAKKYQLVDKTYKMEVSNIMNEHHMAIMENKKTNIEKLFAEAKSSLVTMEEDGQKYAEITESLILQGLFTLLEPVVVIRCKTDDRCLIQNMIPNLKDTYFEKTKIPVELSIDAEQPLEPDSGAGVELRSPDNKILLENTLASRLNMIAQSSTPHIRTMIYGPNVNRKHMD